MHTESTDVFTKAKRSQVMSRIHGAGNRDTELRLIALMRAAAISGWRRGSKITGRPDFVFPKQKVAVFVDGCFWHGCPRHATWPKNNAEFWLTKIRGNKARDHTVSRQLRQAGWRVLRIWECQLVAKRSARTLARIQRMLQRAPA